MARTKTVSYSELDAFRQCRLKHQLAWKEWWLPPTTSAALSRGTLFHKVMEAFYTGLRGDSVIEVKGENGNGEVVEWDPQERIVYLLTDEKGNQTDEQELVEWMFEGYKEQYGDEESWEILGVEHQVDAMLPTRRGTVSSFRLKGQVDLLIRDAEMQNGLWIVDHKTCRRLPKEKDLDLDDQMGIYIYLLRRRGLDIRGAIYNAVRTERLKRGMDASERFLRKPLARTEQELETMAMEAYDLFREAHKPRPEGQDAPRSPDSERCGWRCPYTEPCLAGRKGSNMREMLEDTGFAIDKESPRGSREPAKEGA